MSDPVISVNHLGKAYRIWESPAARILSPLQAGLGLKERAAKSYRDFWALKDVSFEVRKGEAVGIIGRNGSGKSTLLQIIAGTSQPTEGQVTVKGRVAALLEPGRGFNPGFTGRENVYLSGAGLGLSRTVIDHRFEAIADFADLGDFLDQPVKTYSSGMMIRLAFAVQTAVEPDILIIDEALGVGDFIFQQKCAARMRALREQGAALLFVSHDMAGVRDLCERTLYLSRGEAVFCGASQEAIARYLRQANSVRDGLKHGTAPGAPGTGAPATEVHALRLQLEEARRQLQASQGRVGQLELQLEAVSRWARKPPSTFWQRRLSRWQADLAKRTAHPLAKLLQYEPRPLRLEKFPRPSRLPEWPRICLITPSYQQAAFLPRTMHSILDQGYPNLAYGVQDGGSTDDSAVIITGQLARLAHAESSPDQGQGDAIRKGFAKLYPRNEDIMAWVNSDDLLMPGALHYVGEYFARHPEVDVIYGHRVVIDDEGRETGRWFLPRYDENTLPWFDLVPQETLFWRAGCYRAVGEIDPAYQFALDWDLLIRFEQAGFLIRRLPYFLGCFRVHAHQKTTAHIHTVGEEEMRRLRRCTHGREVHALEIQRYLDQEIRRSAMVERLFRLGIRY